MKAKEPSVRPEAHLASVLAIFAGCVLAAALAVWGVRELLTALGPDALAWLSAALLVLALPALAAAALAGWYFGRVEVRGFLSGVDRTVDALGTAVVHGAKGVASGRAVASVAPVPGVQTIRVLPALGDGEDVVLD